MKGRGSSQAAEKEAQGSKVKATDGDHVGHAARLCKHAKKSDGLEKFGHHLPSEADPEHLQLRSDSGHCALPAHW